MTDRLDQKVQVQSLVDIVAERLEAAIISGTLEPGSRLSEQALATSLGVSRGPLREAIRRLEGRKLLERKPNIGVRVAALSLRDLREILQVREALEGMACALAARHMSDADIAALAGLLDDHEGQKSVRDGTGYYQESKDYDFHFSIVTGSGNQRLIQMLLGDLYYLLRVYRYKSSTKPGRAQEALQEHQEIIAALTTRDSVAAEAAMRRHLRNARRYVEEQLAAEGAAVPEPVGPLSRKPGRIGSLG
ncbi:GntR family transcriptional regulator [Sphingobium sufflavum]|uniref:GntR family transcriptional regulator n=1 Tax=Sphingobium sufflavum TaxID=1129547 RepID=UPI001F2D6B9C|nr:GntR family transcriptional regulator [Sphingobium sufflavum]MCE7795557.1 GntR family transcriptional regulator [Sphingobium sufflavum]